MGSREGNIWCALSVSRVISMIIPFLGSAQRGEFDNTGRHFEILKQAKLEGLLRLKQPIYVTCIK